jgi:hypothetical protein
MDSTISILILRKIPIQSFSLKCQLGDFGLLNLSRKNVPKRGHFREKNCMGLLPRVRIVESIKNINFPIPKVKYYIWHGMTLV